LLNRRKVEGFIIPNNTPSSSNTPGKNNGDDYVGPAGEPRTVIHRVEVIGGLPSGSTPEKPEGDNYSDVPPEEERK
jgi:hypothetical protein